MAPEGFKNETDQVNMVENFRAVSQASMRRPRRAAPGAPQSVETGRWNGAAFSFDR
jgi:hypothetical protein